MKCDICQTEKPAEEIDHHNASGMNTYKDSAKCKQQEVPNTYAYDLWKFFCDNHNLHLLESELHDIIQVVGDFIKSEQPNPTLQASDLLPLLRAIAGQLYCIDHMTEGYEQVKRELQEQVERELQKLETANESQIKGM